MGERIHKLDIPLPEAESGEPLPMVDPPKPNGKNEPSTIIPLRVTAGLIDELHETGQMTIGEIELLSGSFEPSMYGDAVRLLSHFVYQDGAYLEPSEARKLIRRIPSNQLETLVRELVKAIEGAAVPPENGADSAAP